VIAFLGGNSKIGLRQAVVQVPYYYPNAKFHQIVRSQYTNITDKEDRQTDRETGQTERTTVQ